VEACALTGERFLRGVVLLGIVLMLSWTTGDPDLWGHVRFGQDMMAAGTVRLPETYSFTSDRPWINHEWLAEVAMAASFGWFGAIGLNLLRIAIVASVLALVWQASARATERHRILIVGAAALGIVLRAHPIRPQLFSLLLFAVMLTLLNRTDNRKTLRPLALVPVVMALWVNLHGGWIVGFGAFGLWCLMTMSTASAKDRVALAAAAVAALAATLLNPYGLGMWEFLATTVRMDRPRIADWLPLYMLSYRLWGAWIAALGLVAISAARPRSFADHKYLVVAAALGMLAIRVSRLDAFFAIAAAFVAARAMSGDAIPAHTGSAQHRSGRLAFAFGACAIAASVVAIPRAVTIRMAPDSVPDTDVVSYVHARQLRGTLLTWFDWGEYTIWHFGPRLKVSMDGRRETVYSDEVVAAHTRFYLGEPQAWRYADALQPDYVWLPKRLPVVRELQINGWHALCEGSSSILLTRRHIAPPCGPALPRKSAVSFPQM
jgi:hypothetical protein